MITYVYATDNFTTDLTYFDYIHDHRSVYTSYLDYTSFIRYLLPRATIVPIPENKAVDRLFNSDVRKVSEFLVEMGYDYPPTSSLSWAVMRYEGYFETDVVYFICACNENFHNYHSNRVKIEFLSENRAPLNSQPTIELPYPSEANVMIFDCIRKVLVETKVPRSRLLSVMYVNPFTKELDYTEISAIRELYMEMATITAKEYKRIFRK
jgi:hypothetical protein